MSFATPDWLWLALAAVPFALIALRWFVQMESARRWSAVIARSLLIALLAGVLAGAATVRTTEDLAVIAVVDVSGSVRTFAEPRSLDVEASPGDELLIEAQRMLERAEIGRSGDDLFGIVAFDERAVAVASPRRGSIADRSLDIGSGSGSDLESAIRRAVAMAPPTSTVRLLLISDGLETSGDALAAARELASGPVPIRIDVVPIEYRAQREVSVESVDAPPRAAAGAPVAVRVSLRSSTRASGTLLILREGEPVDLNGELPGVGQRVSLRPGLNVERVEVPLDDGRVHRFEAVFEPDPVAAGNPPVDRFLGNNRGGAFTLAPGAGSALVVSGSETGGLSVAEALERAGVEVERVRPEGVPSDLLGMQNHDLIVLDSVPADALPAATHDLLVTFARDLGGGLVMVGGRGSFGAGGWRGSSLEAALPVKLELPERLVMPEAAVVFVLDRSGSMAFSLAGSSRTQQQIANEATVVAIRSLEESDLVGVVSFSSDPRTDVELAERSELETFEQQILGISPDGGTRIGPALAMAGDMLRGVEARSKHIIVLSDGASSDAEELPDLAQSLAEDGMRISTIAVGDMADGDTMQSVAVRGRGVYHTVINPLALPQIFLRAVRIVRSPMIKEGRFQPRFVSAASPVFSGMEGVLRSPPPLYGLALTQQKDEPGVVTPVVTPDGEPVLAEWPFGLGRVIALTTDSSTWARDWLGWQGYTQLWESIARRAATGGSRDGSTLVLESAGDALELRYDAIDERGRPVDLLSVPVTVYSPSGKAESVELEQVGPGVYRGSIEAGEAGAYVALARPAKNGQARPATLGGLNISASTEFRRLESDGALVREIARVTGGRELDPASLNADVLFDRSDVVPRETVLPMWPALLGWALLVLMLDIGTRRIAWDRFGSVQDPARAGALASERLAQAKARTGGPSGVEKLTMKDAEKLQRDAARERARASRGPQAKPNTARDASGTTERGPSKKQDPKQEPESGLLAAKRRARERFDR